MKLPLLHNRRYTPLKAVWEFVVVAPSIDAHPAQASVAPTQLL
jgi:hypothetical protein